MGQTYKSIQFIRIDQEEKEEEKNNNFQKLQTRLIPVETQWP